MFLFTSVIVFFCCCFSGPLKTNLWRSINGTQRPWKMHSMMLPRRWAMGCLLLFPNLIYLFMFCCLWSRVKTLRSVSVLSVWCCCVGVTQNFSMGNWAQVWKIILLRDNCWTVRDNQWCVFVGVEGKVWLRGVEPTDGPASPDLYPSCGILTVCSRLGLPQAIPRISTRSHHLCPVVSFTRVPV